MKKDYPVFKSEEGRRLILRHSSRLLASADFRYQERYVPTSFGRTYVMEAGDPVKPAAVMIHGSCSSSVSWLGDIPALLDQFHIFAVDIVGDAGNSEENRLDQQTEEFPKWLEEVLDGLDIKEAVLIGNSLGGWISLQFAGRFPERASKLILIAASGIVPVRPSFIMKTLLCLMMGKKAEKRSAE